MNKRWWLLAGIGVFGAFIIGGVVICATPAPTDPPNIAKDQVTAPSSTRSAEGRQDEQRSVRAQSSAEALYTHAYDLAEKHDFTGAARQFQQLLDQHPKSELADRARYQKGICFFAADAYERSIDEFKKLQQQHPESHLSVKAAEWIKKAQTERDGNGMKTSTRVTEQGAAEPLPPAELCLEKIGYLAYEQTRPAPPLPDCGPQALQIVMDELGVQVSVQALMERAGTDRQGTSMWGLKKAAEARNLKARGLKVDLPYLAQMPKPTIAWVNGDHYLVIMHVQDSYIGVIDPNKGYRKIAVAQFTRMWDGQVLEVTENRP